VTGLTNGGSLDAPTTPPGAPSPGEARLSCSAITVHFGGLAAVNNVDLAVPPASIVGLVGPNGAGKSTLFGVLSGLVRPSRGRVMLDGADITHTRPQVRSGRGLARTFQHPELFTGLSVREHLVLGYRAKHARSRVWSDLFTMGSLRRAGADEQRSVDELIELLGLGSYADRPALGLPLGVGRMLELGRALAASPTVLLLDEPSAGLDSSETEEFESSLRHVSAERAISVLLVEHDVDLVMRTCSTVYVLDFGLLIASGSPGEVSDNPAVQAAYLGEEVADDRVNAGGGAGAPAALEEGGDGAPPGAARPPAGTAGGGEALRSGGAPAAAQPQEAATAGEPEDRDHAERSPVLVVEDLSVAYGEASAVSDVSFTAAAGSALAILGANGAGKSSVARAISGLVPRAGGRIVLAGRDIGGWPAHRIRRAGLVHLPESRGIFPGLTVADNLRMAAGALEGRRARREAVERALEIFPALAARHRQQACLLSGGEQQMLSMARALALSPQVLIADELSLGLAPKLVDLVFDGLTRARQAGVTVIMIEQYVHRALVFADDCVVLQRGQLAWRGPANAAHGEVLRHYLGDALTRAG
jgi:branched-chain amino acid transport system ATP-binding protein